MHLWLDDVRPAPPGWTRAHNAAEAWALLVTGDVEFASFDHDLGPGPDGTSLVLRMIEHDVWPAHKPTVHSANPGGSARMRGLIDRYGPY